jgi:hypothetical protein
LTNAAFILALALGAVILIGMLWVSNTASYHLSIRKRYRKAAFSLSPDNPTFMDDDEEPELDLGDVTEFMEPARRARERVG